MGILGALSTAVTGLRAQSYVMENISGNIANSQTTAFKRQDTSFSDMIPSAGVGRQVSGSVTSNSRSTNTVQGDMIPSSIDTHMAINGDGYFTIGKSTGAIDGTPVFGGTNLYTRRGDFEIDKDGFLVNGAGYYLMTLPIDRQTGNVSASVPQVLRLSNEIMPARTTTTIAYRANLPLFPATTASSGNIPNSELLTGLGFSQDPRTATASRNPATSGPGTVMADPDDLTNADLNEDDTITLQVGAGAVRTFTIGTDPGEFNDLDDLVAAINGDGNLDGLTAASTGGRLTLTADNNTANFTLGGTGTAVADLGFTAGTFNPITGTGTGVVLGQDSQTFLDNSIAGGTLTAYDSAGSPVSIQLRWAKVDSTGAGGADTWNLFYQSDSDPANTDPAWQNLGTDFTFGPNMQLNPPVASINIPAMTVDGAVIGDVQMNFGANGLTQFADPNGKYKPIELDQNGYSSGDVSRVAINGNRITAFYSNGQVADIAEIPMVSFNADNMLQRLDGGAFAETMESGAAVPSANGTIVGSQLEGSNTDIADEFTKLIVTQQAYAANTRIVTTADQMLQEVMSMKR
jgi:flagellar hook protein FlgE